MIIKNNSIELERSGSWDTIKHLFLAFSISKSNKFLPEVWYKSSIYLTLGLFEKMGIICLMFFSF